MAKITIDSDDLLILVRHCADNELNAMCHRGVTMFFRQHLKDDALVRFTELHNAAYEQTRNAETRPVMMRYDPILKAITDGTGVADTLAQLADWLGRR